MWDVSSPTNAPAALEAWSLNHWTAREVPLVGSDDGHSDQSEVVPHCSVDVHFSNNEQC